MPLPKFDADSAADDTDSFDDNAHLGTASDSQRTTPARANIPDVGDISLKKAKDFYNTYTLKISFGQLEAIRHALENDHDNALADELLELFNWYVEKVPRPGEDPDEFKAKEKAAKETADGQKAEDEGESPIPMPPGEESGGPYPAPGDMADDEDEDYGPEPSSDVEHERGSAQDMAGMEDTSDEADQRIPEPEP